MFYTHDNYLYSELFRLFLLDGEEKIVNYHKVQEAVILFFQMTIKQVTYPSYRNLELHRILSILNIRPSKINYQVCVPSLPKILKSPKYFFISFFFFCKKRILKVISFVCSQELDLSHPMHSKNTYKSRVPFSTEAEKVWNEPFSLSSFACFLGRFSSEFHQHNVPDY